MSPPSSQVQLVSSALKPCVFSSSKAFLLLASTATRSFLAFSFSSHSSFVIGPFAFTGGGLTSVFEVFPFASDFDIFPFFFFFSFFSFLSFFFSFFFSFLPSTLVGSILDSEWLFRLFLLSLEDSDSDEEDDEVDEEEDDLLCFLEICLISSLELLNTGFSFLSFLCFLDFLEDPDLLLDSLLLETESLLLLLFDVDSPLLLRFFDIDSPLLLLADIDLLLDLLLEDRDLLLLLRLGLGMA